MFNQINFSMRKFTLLAVLALGAMTQLNAQSRSWDFTNWSDETVANLKASNANGGNWSDIEKADGSTESVEGKCFWQVSATAEISADGYVMANNVVIKELEGLKYTNTTDRSLAIAVDYPDVSNAGFGPYKGGKYLWLGSKEKDYFVIPSVAPGSTIKMGVESHNKTNARGVNLYVGEGHDGTQLKSPAGEAVALPTTFEDQEWLVPADLTAASDIQIYNTNGCHIYYITVTEPGTAGVANIAVAESENAPMYNLQGVQVDENYKGVVIKNGKKFINK